jgi:tetratricopeptide (TPR) repeat protein
VVVPAMMRMHLLPESYLNGLREIAAESETGRQTFILGHLYPRGQWFYFPLNFLIKCTVPFLLLLAAGILAWRFWAERKRELVFLAIPPAIYLLVSMRSGLNMGIRHVLPMLPFLVLLAAAGAWAMAQRVRWGAYCVALLLVLHAASSLRAFPDYICYGNELWGGPAKVNEYLTDSNSDWGQQLLEARDYMAKHPGEPCWAVFRYHVDIRDWGVPCNDLQHALYRSDMMEPLPRTLNGLFLISGRDLTGDSPLEKGYDWARPFVGKTPVGRIGGSAMYVFQGEFDMTIPAAMKEERIERALLRQGQVKEALDAAQKAVALVPESGMAHAGYCAALQAAGELERATAECRLALTLLDRNPEWNRESIDDVQNLMKTAGMVPGDAAHGR